MSPTNIRHGSELVSRAGQSWDDLATIMPFGRKVYIDCLNNFPQEVINTYTKLLDKGIQGQWLSSGKDVTRTINVVEPSPPLEIPRVCMSHALSQEPRYPQPIKHESAPQPWEQLGYLLIVQGRNACERSKVVVEQRKNDAGKAMLHEAMNGFSVVFTGAMLRSDICALFDERRTWHPSFKKVPDIPSLVEFSQKNAQVVGDTLQIGIIC